MKILNSKKGKIKAIKNDKIPLIFTKNANSFIFIFSNTTIKEI